MSSFLTDVLALVHDVSNRAGVVAAGNTVALLVVDLMYGAIVNAVNYNTSIASESQSQTQEDGTDGGACVVLVRFEHPCEICCVTVSAL